MIEALVVGLAAFAGLFTQRVLGFGTGMFLVPALLLYTTAPAALVVTWLVGAVVSVSVLVSTRHAWAVPQSVLWRLFIASVPGLLLGIYILTVADKALMQVIIGILIIISLYVQDNIFPKRSRKLVAGRGISLSGFAGGLLGTVAAVAQVPILLYLRSFIVTPDQIRQLLSSMYLLMNIVVVPVLLLVRPESLSEEGLPIFLKLLPVVVLAIWIGKLAASKINIKIYHRLVYVSLYLAAIVTVGLGVANLG